jgi:hypothetical protein
MQSESDRSGLSDRPDNGHRPNVGDDSAEGSGLPQPIRIDGEGQTHRPSSHRRAVAF